MIKKAYIFLVMLLVLSLSFSGCGSKDAANAANETKKAANLSLGTSGSGSGVYVIGGILSNVVNKNQEASIVSPQVTAGFEENIGLVNDNTVDLAMVSTNMVVVNQDKFPNVRGLFNYALMPMHVIVDANKGIKSIEDLKGKKVNVGAPGQATRHLVELLLNAYGITFDDIKVSSLTTGEGISALKDGQIDASIFLSTTPMPAVAELALTKEINILPIEGVNADKFNEAANLSLAKIQIPAGSYKGVDQVVNTITAPILVIANKDLDTEQVYQLTKATWENLDEFKEASATLSGMTLNEIVLEGWNGLPLHPGAEKYFKEVGIIK